MRKFLFVNLMMAVSILSWGQVCPPANMPFTEDFDNWPLPCTTVNDGTEDWVSYPGVGTDLYAEASFWTYNIPDSMVATSSEIIIPTGMKAQIDFDWSHLNNAIYPEDKLKVQIKKKSATTWTTLLSFRAGDGNFNDPTAGNTVPGNFISEIILLDSATYAGDTVQVRFNAISGFGPDLFINNFQLRQQPACPDPSALTATTLTDTEVGLVWSSPAGNSNIEYGVSGFTPGSGTTISGVTSPYIVGSLSAGTQYDFYIEDDCGGSGTSVSILASATTRMSPLTAPYIETFDTITNTPSLSADWLTFSSSTKVWQTTTSVFNGPAGDNTSGFGNYAYVDDNTFPDPNTSDVTMMTRLVDVTSLTVPVLEFYYWSNPSNGINRFYVDIWDGANWNNGVWIDSVGTGANWQQIIIDLSNYTITGAVMARFIVDEDNGFPFPVNQVSLDDIGFVEMPACPSPASLSISGITSSGAIANWVGTTNDQFDVEVGASGFTPGTGTIFTSTTNSVALTALTPGTFYDVYLYNNCSGSSNGYSDTVGSFSFATSCTVINAFPYTESFDGAGWVSGTGFGNTNDTIDVCWDRNPAVSGTYFWGTRTGSTGSGGTGPTVDQSGSGNYVFTEGSNGGTGDLAYITLPDMDLTSLTTPWFSYYYHMAGNNMGTLNLQVSTDTGATWTTVSTWAGTQQNDIADPWLEDIVDITAYIAPLVKIRFEAIKGNGFASDMAVDEVLIQEAPPCPKPLSVTSIGSSDTTITLSWISDVDTFDVEWGPVGFGQGTGTNGTFGDDTATVPGLMSNTCYDFYVRSNCTSVGDGTSTWVGPFTFCTDCLPVTTLPWTEDFDVNGLNCWTIINNDNDAETWELDTLANNANSGSNSAAVNSPFFGTSDDWLISPQITLTGNERLKYSTRALFGFDNIELTVLVSTTNDNIADFTDTIVAQTTITGASYVQYQANLSAYTGDVYVAFAIGLPQGFNSGNLRLDDIIIEPLPPCLEPDSLSLVIASSNYVVVDWLPGGGTTWNVEYGVPGYTPGTGVSFNTNVTSDTVNGLSPNTNYEIYVQSDCGTNGTSVWIGPLAVRTTCITQTLPFFEDFNVDLGCMVAVDGGASPDTWIWSAAGGTTTFGDIDGTGYAIVDSDEFGNGIHMIESLNSPPIDAGSLPSTSSLILEWDQFYNWIGSDSAIVQVYDGANWVTVLSMFQDFGAFGAPDHRLIDVTAYANANFQVRFWYDDANSWAWWWAVDNFSVTEQLCGIASNPDTTFATPNSAGLSWTSNGSNWNIEWGPTGFIQGTGTGDTIQNVTSNPYVLTGLQPSTCYDYYVQDTCLGIGNGPWAGPFTFCTSASCPAPSNLSATNITLNSFDVNWTGGGVGTNYNVEYGLAGFAQGAGTLVSTTATTLSVSAGITPSTTYDIYVQDSCGLGDVSTWIGPLTISTLCAALVPPYLEDFDANGFISGTGFNNAGDAINSCWSRTDNSGGGNFLGARSGSTGSGGTGPSSGNSLGYVFYEASGSAVGDSAWLNTPVFDLSGTTSPYFKYQYHMFGDDMGDLVTEVNTGSGWVNLNTISGQQQLADTDPWITDSLDVTAYIGSAVQFRFIATSGGGFESDMAIENVEIADAAGPNCPAPLGLDTANVSCIDADLIWVSSSNTVSSAVEYGPTGFTPGSGTIVPNASSPLSVTSLTPGTAYEFYVVDFCATDTSAVVGPYSFTTASGPLSPSFTASQIDTTFNNANVTFDASASTGATSYAWNFGDGNTGTGVNPTHGYSNNGTYTVVLTITGDCGVDSISQQVVVAGVSLAENRLGRSLQVYPNPTNGQVNVSFDTESSDDATISVLDLSGKVIMNLTASDLNGKYDGTIDISNLARGTYLMKIESGDLTTQRRIIKQ